MEHLLGVVGSKLLTQLLPGWLCNELSPEFDRYLTSTNVSLEEERKDWRKAMAWVSAESVRLESTQLAQFEEEVKAAQAAAEKAFREDVAVRISERIQQTETNLKTLNKTLAACPTFSNGERYEFEARPAVAYNAEEVFGDPDARAWLKTPNTALSGKAPVSLLDVAGIESVMDILGRIEHGVF